ncbi:MAG: hypothetical protein HY566_00195 [Candidatus Kerfeldbacteria bacterium]|nr:hypothetical protein [Candidatus Kerfeldbacteria bacterium]
MTLCPGCNHGVLEPLTPGLRAYLKIHDGSIRAVCSDDCGTVAKRTNPAFRPNVASDVRPERRGFVMKFRGEML